MVLFIGTRGGYDDLRSIVESGTCPVWFDFGVLAKDEIDSLMKAGVDTSWFTVPHDFADAIETITDHHPGERIWTEVEFLLTQDGTRER